MRQSNVCSPVQNQACLLITSRLYDRRGLDCTSPLPLFNSLAHLVHLTATSPKIREILTRDGGLERLVRILRDFCTNPPPAQDPALFYGLLPPWNGEDEAPALVPGRPVDREAAQRFSLAFQSIVNIGVRGSEAVRTRVVQAGTLEVVAALLETWLLAKGFPLALPPRRQKKKQSSTPRPQPESILVVEDDQSQEIYSGPQALPLRASRSATITQRPRASSPRPALHGVLTTQVVPQQSQPRTPHETYGTTSVVTPSTSGSATGSALPTPIPTPTDTPTPSSVGSPPATQPNPTQNGAHQARGRSGTLMPRRATDEGTNTSRDPSLDPRGTGTDHSGQNTEDSDAEMDATTTTAEFSATLTRPVAVADPQPENMIDRRGDMEVDVMAAVNMVMTVDGAQVFAGTQFGGDAANAAAAAVGAAAAVAGTMPDETPRAVLRTIADATAEGVDPAANNLGVGVGVGVNDAPAGTASPSQPTPPGANPSGINSARHRIRIVAGDAGPFRQEDVLRALQLLAYLTKYPHVRQEFYKQRVAPSPPPWLQLAPNAPPLPSPQTPTTLFSLVERFTFRPSLSQFSQHPGLIIPTIPPEIQSWAAVIMRNACRKDESRGGIRQCANMLCGKWESAPREFAKCRRCRKAKYCGKECQSQAWSMGHRYWCSARDGEEGEGEHAAGAGAGAGPTGGEDGENRRPGGTPASTGTGTPNVPAATRPPTANGVPPTTTRLHHPQPQPFSDPTNNPTPNNQIGPTSFPMQRSQHSPSPGPSGTQTPPAAQRRGTGGRIARSLGDSLARALSHSTSGGNSHTRQNSNPNLQPVGPEYHTRPSPAQQQQQGQLRIASVPEPNAEAGPGPSTTTSRSNRWSTLFNLPGRQTTSRSSSGPTPVPTANLASSSRTASGSGSHHQRHDSYSDFQSAMTGVGLRRNDGSGSASELSGMVRSSLVIQPPPPHGRPPQPPQPPQQQQRFRLSAFRPEVIPAQSAANDTSISSGGIMVATVPNAAPNINANVQGPPTTALYPPNPPWLRSREPGNESQDVEMGWGEGDP